MYSVERYVKRGIHDSVYSLSEVSCLIPHVTCELRCCVMGMHEVAYIDISGSSFPVADIKRTLDAMSMAKVSAYMTFHSNQK